MCIADHRTAQWARELTDRSRDVSAVDVDIWVETALRRIEEAAQNGRGYIEMLPGHPTDAMYTALRGRGFMVNVIKYQRDGEYTRISW